MSCAVLPGCSTLDIETEPAIPPPSAPGHSELCTLIEPHIFADATLGFFGANRADPGVVADLDWSADVAKVRRCLCDPVPVGAGADRDGADDRSGCPSSGRSRRD